MIEGISGDGLILMNIITPYPMAILYVVANFVVVATHSSPFLTGET